MKVFPYQYPVFFTNIAIILFFGTQYLDPINYEFLIYVGTIVFFCLMLVISNKTMKYPNYLLWALTIWGLFHMAGGYFTYQNAIWYEWILWPISDSLGLLRYDQLVHAGGFFVTTLLGYEILKPHLRIAKITPGIAVILIMTGGGAGAVIEVIEFVVDSIVPESGVGGYVNTSMDLIFNFIGASLAVLFLTFRINQKNTKSA